MTFGRFSGAADYCANLSKGAACRQLGALAAAHVVGLTFTWLALKASPLVITTHRIRSTRFVTNLERLG